MSLRSGPLLLAIVALLAVAPTALAGASAPPALAAQDGGEVPVPTGDQVATAEEPVTVNATYEIQIRPDGDARWTVTTWIDLDDEDDRGAYREVADRFEDGEYSDLGLAAFRQEIDAVSRSTGREMSIREVRRSTSPPTEIANGTGRLSVSFTWTNFANVTGNGTLTVGDAFRTGDRTWFSGLGENQTLTITPPEGYRVSSSSVPITDGSLRWDGPQTFDPGAVSATFTGGEGPTPPPDTPWLLIVTAVAILIGIVLLAVYLFGSRPGWLGGAADETESEPGVEAPASVEPEGEPDDAPAESEPDDVDVELLSDEERVERLLDRNGGRMKQATIVKETGWSNAKVSQLLSSMEEEDRIDKLRIGRENLISFPDEDVTDVEK